jgi:hypothetical protein
MMHDAWCTCSIRWYDDTQQSRLYELKEKILLQIFENIHTQNIEPHTHTFIDTDIDTDRHRDR